MKKLISVFLVLTMLLTLAACGHSHTGGDWEVDAAQHWKVCECGENFEAGEHTLDDMSVCTICGAEVFVWDEGADVSMYDAYGNLIRNASYDAEGNETYEGRYSYTYDAEGSIRSMLSYVNGVLTEEYAYEDGILVTILGYHEDGTYQISMYDENGNISSCVTYDADGQSTGGIYSEYTQDGNGNWYEVRSSTVDMDGSKYVGEFNEVGDQITWITYDPEGNIEHNERYEITYTEEGHKDTVKTYSFDVLVEEKIYTLVTYEDGWMNYPGTIIEYFEDGSKTVTEYDENDEVVSVTIYDAEGNVTE